MGFGANVLCIWMCSPLENVSCLLHSSPSSHPSFLIVVSFSDAHSVFPLCTLREGLIFSVWKQSSPSTVEGGGAAHGQDRVVQHPHISINFLFCHLFPLLLPLSFCLIGQRDIHLTRCILKDEMLRHSLYLLTFLSDTFIYFFIYLDMILRPI